MSKPSLEITRTDRRSWEGELPTVEELSWATAVLPQIMQHVTVNPDQPCAYEPWTKAFQKAGVWPRLITGLAERLCKCDWSELQTEKSEFAITYLEADVMQFRSGYFKGKLIKRLRQTELSKGHRERLVALLKRTVLNGAGRQEFMAYCNLAATLRPADLRAWLIANARDTRMRFHPYEEPYTSVLWKDLTDSGTCLRRGGHVYLWVVEQETEELLFVTAERVQTPEQQVARNAWYMLMHIEKRLLNGPKSVLPLKDLSSD